MNQTLETKYAQLDRVYQKEVMDFIDFLLQKSKTSEKERLNKRKKVKIGKYCGVLKLIESPVEIQRRLRSEWN